MKQVIFSDTNNLVVNVEKTTPYKFYGIEYEGRKAFVTMTTYKTGRVVAISNVDPNWGNMYGNHCDSLREMLDYANSRGDTVYEFNTAKELFSWMSK